MADRFQLEQEILRCWNIIEDIGELNQAGKYDLIEPTLEFYNFKFDKMFETFEDCIQTEFSYKKENIELKKEINTLKLDNTLNDWPSTPHSTGSYTSGREDVNPDYPFPF
jgi:hypothetical protein